MKSIRAFGCDKRFMRPIMGALISSVALLAAPAESEPHSDPVQILAVRPYYVAGSTEFAYIATTPTSICSGAGHFVIALNTPAGEGMLAIALTALSTGRSVTLEISNSTGCNLIANGGPQLASLTLLASGYSGPY